MLFKPVKQFVRTACESYVNQYYFNMSIDKLKLSTSISSLLWRIL